MPLALVPKTRKPSIKSMPVQSSVGDAASAAYSLIEDLKSEIAEVVGSMENSAGLSATQRYATLQETLNALEEPGSEPDCPDCLDGVMCSYTENRERKLTRRGRLDNALGALSAAAAAIRDWVQTQRDEIGASDEDDGADESQHDELESQITEAEEFADTLEEHESALDGCEFPGMMG